MRDIRDYSGDYQRIISHYVPTGLLSLLQMVENFGLCKFRLFGAEFLTSYFYMQKC